MSLDLQTRNTQLAATAGATLIGGRDAYLPPEVKPLRSEPATPKADMYAVGAGCCSAGWPTRWPASRRRRQAPPRAGSHGQRGLLVPWDGPATRQDYHQARLRRADGQALRALRRRLLLCRTRASRTSTPAPPPPPASMSSCITPCPFPTRSGPAHSSRTSAGRLRQHVRLGGGLGGEPGPPRVHRL